MNCANGDHNICGGTGRTGTFGDTGLQHTINLTDEYTTAILKTNTIAALPAYAGFGASHGTGQGTTCSATAVLSTDESSYSIRRFKYRFAFDGTPPEGMVLSWTVRFTPAGGGSVTDTPMTWTVPAGYTGGNYSPTNTENEPSSNGTTTIVDVAVDCSGVVAWP